MNLWFIQTIREFELNKIIEELPEHCKILEIGAGSGWQARRLSEKGFSVQAIDVRESRYADSRVWPVLTYDGEHIPFPDDCFDVVFSSNVLEHIANVETFQTEIRRVIKNNGTAIHILPTSLWRIWTTLTHYPIVLMMLWKFGRSIVPYRSKENSLNDGDLRKAVARRGWLQAITNALLPPPHGKVGNCISEICWFSRFRWNRLFRMSGWIIKSRRPNNLCYTGNALFGSSISLPKREKLSRVLGSVCHIYILKPATDPETSNKISLAQEQF
jgi:SAM-dependent methyltransferase